MSFHPEHAASTALLSAYQDYAEPFALWLVDEVSNVPSPAQDSQVHAKLDKLNTYLEQLVQSTHPNDEAARSQLTQRFYEHDAAYVPSSAHTLKASGQGPLDWLLGATYSQRLDFLTWNKERHMQLQQRITRDVPVLKEALFHNVETAISHGAVPPAARTLAAQALRETSFVAMDTFEAGFRRCAGLFLEHEQRYGTPFTIMLANSYYGGTDGLAYWNSDYPYLVAHENWHLIGAKAGGDLRTIRNRTLRTTWWNEAEVDHFAQVGFHGEPDITSPDLRKIPCNRYRNNKALSHLIKTGGEIQIPQPLIGEAYLESLDDDTSPKARTKLDQLLQDSFRNIIRPDDQTYAELQQMTGHTPHMQQRELDLNIVELIGQDILLVPAAKQWEVLEEWRRLLQAELAIDESASVTPPIDTPTQ